MAEDQADNLFHLKIFGVDGTRFESQSECQRSTKKAFHKLLRFTQTESKFQIIFRIMNLREDMNAHVCRNGKPENITRILIEEYTKVKKHSGNSREVLKQALWPLVGFRRTPNLATNSFSLWIN